jgi:hypothetical protein
MTAMRMLALLLLVLAALGSSAQAQARRHLQPKSPVPHASESPPSDAPTAPAVTPTPVGPATTQVTPQAPPSSASPAVSSEHATAQTGATTPQRETPTSASAIPPPPAADKGELAGLQQDLAQVMDDLVQARARVALLGKSLFKTRVRVKLDNRAAPEQVAAHVALWLDGAPIWNGDGGTLRDPEHSLFEGFAAPGPHTLTVEVEQRARADEAYRYTLHESYRFTVVQQKRTDLRLVLDDDSDMAEDFPDDHEGKYDVRTRLQVRAVGLNEN